MGSNLNKGWDQIWGWDFPIRDSRKGGGVYLGSREPEILKNISIFLGIFLGKIYHFPSKTKVLYEFVGIFVSRKLLVKYF